MKIRKQSSLGAMLNASNHGVPFPKLTLTDNFLDSYRVTRAVVEIKVVEIKEVACWIKGIGENLIPVLHFV